MNLQSLSLDLSAIQQAGRGLSFGGVSTPREDNHLVIALSALDAANTNQNQSSADATATSTMELRPDQENFLTRRQEEIMKKQHDGYEIGAAEERTLDFAKRMQETREARYTAAEIAEINILVSQEALAKYEEQKRLIEQGIIPDDLRGGLFNGIVAGTAISDLVKQRKEELNPDMPT